MSDKVILHKGRVNFLIVELGHDVSAETFTSQIRTQPDQEAPLIAEWDVAFVTDGTDGKLILTMDHVTTAQIAEQSGYMDIRRVSAGLPVVVFDRPVEVTIRGTVTAA